MINQTVSSIIESQLGLDAGHVNTNMHLVSDLGADSIDIVEIAFRLGDEFKITIESEEYSNAVVIKDLIALVELKCKGRVA